MKHLSMKTRIFLAAAVPASVFVLAPTEPKPPQDSMSEHEQHQEHQAKESAELTLEEQIAEIRAGVARLESALNANHEGVANADGGTSMQGGMSMGEDGEMSMTSMKGMSSGGMKMGMGSMKGMKSGSKMKEMAGMGGMSSGSKMKGMGSMGAGGMGGMGMGMGMGMDGMGMGGMMGMMGKSSMSMGNTQISALPGFPGASHIYHVGSSGFFLDHAEHVALSKEQATTLSRARESALLSQATSERKIEEAEQELWTLTGSDSPDATKIDSKVREIEKLRGDQRIAFIRAIGEAAEVLSEEQRLQISGMLPAASSTHESHSMDEMSSEN